MTESFGRVLVLGGIRSGKSEYAEELLTRAPQVTYLATGPSSGDALVTAHIKESFERRPEHWTTEEVGIGLIDALTSDTPQLVDDLGGWLTHNFETVRWSEQPDTSSLVSAVRDRRAPLVIVSSEVGLTTQPNSESERMFTDALGTLNRQLTEVCDAVVLVVSGAPIWLKGEPPSTATLNRRHRPAPPRTHATPGVVVRGTDLTGLPDPFDPVHMSRPDENSRQEAQRRLDTLKVHGSGLGLLTNQILLTAAQQAVENPNPYSDVRCVLLDSTADDRPGKGEGVYPLLADRAGARLEIIELSTNEFHPTHTDVLTVEEVEQSIDFGRALADRAINTGADLLILGSTADTSTASTGVVCVLTGAEPAEVLARVVSADGHVDDREWMARCATVRDTLRRINAQPRDPKSLLAMIGGTELAVATGLILGAGMRQTTVILDGPLGIAAALLARDLAAPSRHWVRLFDHGGNPLVQLGADVLDLAPFLDLKLGLGEGANALATLPLLQTVLTVSTSLTQQPGPAHTTSPTE